MTGPDWTSARERRAQARAQTKRAQAARTFAARMEAALKAAEAYRSACRACGEEVSRTDDTRNVLVDGLKEYSFFLRRKYGQ
jgi:tRNA U54 and U55 pseudouridine synthase Pus10